MVGTAGAARQPRTDIEEKEAATAPSVRDKMPIGREEKRKLPGLPFQYEYGGGEDYYSVFYAYCFEEFCKAHRDEWIVVAASYDKNGAATQFAVFEDGVETTRVTYADENTLLTVLTGLQHQLDKLAEDQDGKSEETKEKIKKILLLCDGTPKTRRPNMVMFTSPSDEWFRINETDEDLLFMPLWTSDELQEAALVLELGLDDDEIDRRVHVFGGTACFCLSRDASEVTLAQEKLVELIIREIRDGAGLQGLLFEETTEDTRNILLHLEPLPDE
ncbi:hypothetical protein PF005_g28710 [Phytophthora fragariae]|uniref:Uncharacterized protein n=1 Tax=Phytophthora fragariae TaxID=53985 RepID=A0A6A3GVQ9_9STRA|nr:hypothetical protein PF003_g38702 [Phytophthora fragariae]KAE8929189.1 hypothetical protein PF009_g20689 [Phytophthora fragariae]KAE8961054.1 hypothetical protein PF011_g29887 [Phytophthora fragariae]KAE9089235.1 hypothetical protein PF007_g19675 [Phytophthora fragariae]KAE9103327.1 hypothetical protein PF006_g22208 [Phytophthora fragariae]